MSTPIVIDGLQICNWSRDVFLENQRGGVHAINATVAVWEGPLETMQIISRLYELIRNNSDVARLVLTPDDLLASRDDGRVGVMIGFQNASPFGDDYAMVEAMWRLGVRVAQLTYNNQNLVGGACYDPVDSGLTRFGENIVAEMNRVGMLVDVSHVGYQTCRDAVEASSAPIAITHSNPLWFCDNPRNKPDDVMNSVAARGGVVGCCLYPNIVTSDSTLVDYCQMMARLVEQLGVDHVALASDAVRGWDDSYVAYLRNGRWQAAEPGVPGPTWPVWPEWFQTPEDWPNMRRGLLDVGLDQESVDKVLGGNWLRLMTEVMNSGSFDA